MSKKPLTKDQIFLVGCTHFNFKHIGKYRTWAGNTKEEYNELILKQINKFVPEDCRLFLMGDVSDTKDWSILKEINTREIILIDGNHDRQCNPFTKLKFVKDIQGLSVMYGNIFVSHAPIHPQELSYKEGAFNIHAHSHNNSIQDPNFLNLSFDTFRKPINVTECENIVKFNKEFFEIHKRLPQIDYDEDHVAYIEGYKTI